MSVVNGTKHLKRFAEEWLWQCDGEMQALERRLLRPMSSLAVAFLFKNPDTSANMTTLRVHGSGD